jgi:ferrous iron transport protein B
MKKHIPSIALLGNPNSGKSSLFNYLTGLRQDVSNFPGVTVEKKSAVIELSAGQKVEIIDFPGTYSLFPNALEERIVVSSLLNPADDNHPDLVIYVADASQLERHLLLATQIKDLGLPMLFLVNMVDVVFDGGGSVDEQRIASFLHCSVLAVSLRNGYQLDQIEDAVLLSMKESADNTDTRIYKLTEPEAQVAAAVGNLTGDKNVYRSKLLAHHVEWLPFLSDEVKDGIRRNIQTTGFKNIPLQVTETMKRYEQFGEIARKSVQTGSQKQVTFTDRLDRIITNRYAGPVLFFIVMFFVFQSIYSLAAYPMDLIESVFTSISVWAGNFLPVSWWTDLLVNGLLPGLAGVVVFVPQIAILFFLIALLEESGYMSRAVFMFDGIMQRFGMNGRSIVSLISSGACAIPAIMSTRTISNHKERLITILVSPLISCSARIPVYAILIGFVVPDETLMGFVNLQGLVFMGLYVLGILGAFLSALVIKAFVTSDAPSFLLMEMPDYKSPIWRNVFLTVYEKVTSFVLGAGKVILVISVLLWFLASYGPSGALEQAEEQAITAFEVQGAGDMSKEDMIAAYKIQQSYIGIMGRFIEPAIEPLGFDWKIGIALLTSFAAREVFVGTMATIYSIGNTDDEKTIREKMASEVRASDGSNLYSPATSLSLLLFYVFAMQCMSTMAVVRRETGTWKWPVVQFLFMGLLAYASAFIAFQGLA